MSEGIVLDHSVAALYFDGESWHLECSCLWECWDQAERFDATDAWFDHLVEKLRPFADAAIPPAATPEDET